MLRKPKVKRGYFRLNLFCVVMLAIRSVMIYNNRLVFGIVVRQLETSTSNQYNFCSIVVTHLRFTENTSKKYAKSTFMWAIDNFFSSIGKEQMRVWTK